MMKAKKTAKKPVAEPVLDIFDLTAKWHIQEDGTITSDADRWQLFSVAVGITTE